MNILRIDSSAALTTSKTRAVTDTIVDHLQPSQVVRRDVAADPLPIITDAWAEARLVPADERSAEENALLALSDDLIRELRDADTIVIGLPMYNFSLPAALKAWIDLVARPAETFRYTSDGPEGLLSGKRAIIVAASGGVPIGSDWDYATGYMRHVLAFLGITDTHLVTAKDFEADPDAQLAALDGALDAPMQAA